MVKVNYIPPRDVPERLYALKPYRDELCRLMTHYRFSSAEYRRLSEAAEALDEVCALLAGDRQLLHLRMPRSEWKG